MASVGDPVLVAVFVAAAAAIWIAGIQLSRQAGMLATRRRWARMGPDSVVVFAAYAVAMAGLPVIRT